jgi:hypothetical protein
MLEADQPNNTDPYRTLFDRTLFDRTFERLLQERGEPDAPDFAKLLNAIDAYISVEVATRGAGFVLGFEACRQLMLGETESNIMKGGAE